MAKRILVVDDERDISEVLKKRLESRGYLVETAPNGKEALKLIRQKPADLIILDIMMPVMDGPQTATALKEDPKTEKIPIIFLSAILDKSESYDEKSGANIVFSKPYDWEQLLGKVVSLIGI